MARFPRTISTALAGTDIAATVAGGLTGLPASASASSRISVTSVIPQGSYSWVQGSYLTLSLCQNNGAIGVRAQRWNNYICVDYLDKSTGLIMWDLTVTKDD